MLYEVITPQFSFVDDSNLATTGGGDLIRFFRDDGDEGAPGAIARLRLFDRALAEAQAQAEEAGRLAAAHARKLADPAYADASIAGQAPVAQDAAAEAGGSLWEQYAAIKDPAERSRFYAEHEKEMDF